MLKKLLAVLLALTIGFNSTLMVHAVDVTPPLVSGVEEGGIYSAPVTISYDEGSATLNDVAIGNPQIVSELGTYVLVVTDASSNVTTVHFTTTDKTAPIVVGVDSNRIYANPVTITFNEGTATLNGNPFSSGTVVSILGDYDLIVTDAYDNSTTVHFSIIDAVAPIVSGVADGFSYSEPIKITFNEGTATLNGNPFVSGTLVSAPASYTLVVSDASSNVTTVRFTITAKTGAVVGLKVLNAGYASISLSWTAVTNVTGYEIWRSAGTSTVYALVTSVSGNSYVNAGLAFNTRYNYKVRLYTMVGTAKVYGGFSAIGYATTALTTPVSTVVSASYTSIRVSWTGIAGASGYQVYRSTSLTGVYTLMTTTVLTSFTNISLITNGLYYYKVRAYRTIGTLKYYSAYSTVLSARPIPGQVVGNTVVSLGYNSLKASWAAVLGATGYEVYRSSTYAGTYTLATATAALTYSIGSLSTNLALYVKVRAYRLVGTVKVYGAFSSIQSAAPIPSAVAVTVTSPSYKSLKLAWAAVAGASGYEVYHLVGPNYVLVQDNATLNLTVDGLVSGETHSYKVLAYRLEGAVKVYSNPIIVSAKALPSTPVVSPTINYNTIQLKWAVIEGAAGYEIHRATTATGVYTLLSSVTAETYSHAGLVFNAFYYYKVRAYTLVGGVKIYGNFTAVLTYKTNVATPTATVLSTSYISVTLSWVAVSGATGYEVTRATILAGPYTLMASATTATSFANTGLLTNTLYYYRVRSFRTVGVVKYYSGYSTVVSIRPIPSVPTGIGFASVGYDSAKLSWIAVAGASGYEVYTSSSTNGVFALKATTTALNATITGLPTNVPIYGKVRAYRLVGTVKVYGAYTAVVSTSPIPAKPVVTVASLSHTSLKVSWPAIPGASGYEVYHLVGSNYVPVQDSTELSLTITGLVTGETHTYKVLAYRLVDTVKVYSPETIASGKAFPLTPTVTAVVNYSSIQLNWTALEGVTGYEVYRSTTLTGVYALLSTVTNNTYANTGLLFNTTYYYKVRAYALVGSVKVFGNDTAVLAYKTNVATPVATAVSTSYISATVSWPAVSGASGYEVTRATVLAGPYTLMASAITATSFANTGLLTNTLYYYRVRSFRTVGTVKYYSSYSSVTSIRPIPTVPTGITLVSAGHDSVKMSWSAVAGASGYEIFTSDSETGAFILKSTVTSLTSTVPGFTTNVSVYAKVRAYRLVGTVKVYGAYSSVFNAKPTLPSPVVTTTIIDIFTMKLTWTAIPGASGYEVYWLGSDGYYLLTETKTNIYLDEEMFPGDTYTYKILAYKLTKDSRIYSAGTIVTGLMTPATPANAKIKITGQESFTLSWDEAFVDGFEMVKAATATGTFTYVGTYTTNEGFVSGLVFNTTYYFKVRAFVIVDNKKIYGEYSSVIIAKTAVTPPAVVLTKTTTSSVTIAWPSYSNINGYEIYRATSVTGTYTLITTQLNTSYTSGVLAPGTTYYYKVRAYRIIGTLKYYSAFSVIITAKAAPMPPVDFQIVSNTPTSIVLGWTAVTGASGYEVSVSTTYTGAYTPIYTGSAANYTHTGLKLNQMYYYKIRSYYLYNGVKVYGSYYEDPVFATAGVSTPTLMALQDTNQYVYFFLMDDFIMADEIIVYEVNPSTSERTKVASIGYAGYTSIGKYIGFVDKTVTFVAVARAYLSGTNYYSYESAPFAVTLGHPIITSLSLTYTTGSTARITWANLFNDVEIYRSEQLNGDYTMVASGKFDNYFYIDTNLTVGKTYYYKIRAISTSGITNQPAFSEFSNIVTGTTAFRDINFFSVHKISPYDQKIVWSLLDGATGYELYRQLADGSYELFAITGNVDYYYVSGLQPATPYSYAIRGFTTVDGVTIYSRFNYIGAVYTVAEPKFTITPLTTFDGAKTVTVQISNDINPSCMVHFSSGSIVDVTDGSMLATFSAKDTATQTPVTSTNIYNNQPKTFDLSISSETVTFGPNVYVKFIVSSESVLYDIWYSPTLGTTYVSQFLPTK